MTERRLFLLRHAKASWTRDSDFDRPLAPRGERVLPGVGLAIDGLLDRPLDLVLASTAARVRATIDGVLPRLSPPRELRWQRSLYLAGLNVLFDEVRELPETAHDVLLCGHNPGLHELALALLADDAASPALDDGLPPAGLVVIGIDDEWPDVDAGSGRLVTYLTPATDSAH
jgi:phosphohistidine phosphatase